MSALRQQLESLKDRGLLDRFAWAFATCLDRFAPDGKLPDDCFLLAALTAHHTLADKHVCFVPTAGQKLSDVLTDLETADDFALPAWHLERDSDFCAEAPGRIDTPLLRVGERLYLNRYYAYEQSVAKALTQRLATASPRARPIDPDALLVKDFTLDESQRAAIAAALVESVTVITGGPGTGKTTLLCVILAAMLREEPKLRIAACAPTGKAQARMKDSIQTELGHLRPEIRQALPLNEAGELPVTYGTIHRLLGVRADSNQFWHHAGNPLEADVVVADEISMADLPLFCHLLAAVPPEAKLILLGDRDQLSSVESGAVLSDICEAWKDRPAIARLLHSHRFKEGSLIDNLRKQILEQNADAALAALKSPSNDRSVIWKTVPAAANLSQPLMAELAAHPEFGAYRNAATPAAALAAFDTFRILAATRRGFFGVERLNDQLQRLLHVETNGKGFPILVTENDRDVDLFNGDVGLCWPDPEAGGAIRVFFPNGSGGCRSVPLSRLPAHEPVFAMTIHKSQGSGFDHVLLILPENAENKLLTRELVYTGLTRAKKDCVLWSSEASLRAAITHPTQRDSGLKQLLAQ